MGFLLRLFVQQGGSLQPLKWQYPEIVFVNPEYVGLLWSKQFLHISSSNFLHVFNYRLCRNLAMYLIVAFDGA